MRRCRTHRRALPVLLLVLLLPALSSLAAPDAPIELRDGGPVEVVLPAGTELWNGRIDLPSDAVALSVVASGDADVDLFLRHGRPVGEDHQASSDVSSAGEGPHEIVLVRAGDRVPPRGARGS